MQSGNLLVELLTEVKELIKETKTELKNRSEIIEYLEEERTKVVCNECGSDVQASKAIKHVIKSPERKFLTFTALFDNRTHWHCVECVLKRITSAWEEEEYESGSDDDM